MNSDKMTSAVAEPLGTKLRRSNVARIAALSALALFAAIAVPPGLIVGPTQPRAMTPADPAETATALRTQIQATRVSFELIAPRDDLSEISSSYAERHVGPLSFPDGAINVPWGAALGSTNGRAFPSADGIRRAEAGQTITGPRYDAEASTTPALMQASFRPGATGSRTVDAIEGLRTSIAFERLSTQLSDAEASALDAIAAQLRDGDFRIELRAFGGTAADRSHSARRIALRRALAVRNHLMGAGIDQERMIVRALGGASDGGPSDRVDVIAAGA